MKPHVKKFLKNMSVVIVLTIFAAAVFVYGAYGLMFNPDSYRQSIGFTPMQMSVAVSIMFLILGYMVYCLWDIYRMYRDHPTL